MKNWLIYSLIMGILCIISPLANAQETLQEEKTTLPSGGDVWPPTSSSQETSQGEKLILPVLADTNLGQETSQAGETKEENTLLSPIVKIDRAISVRLLTGAISYKYHLNNPSSKFHDSMPVWGIGLTISPFKLLAFDVYLQKSNEGHNNQFQGNQNTEANFKREDWVSTASYRYELNEHHSLSLFGGYKWSQSDIDLLIFTVNAPARISRQGVTFKTTGPFVGGGYSWQPFDNESRIAVNLAYGKLTGSYKTFADNIQANPSINPTYGLKFGFYWSGPITQWSRYGKLSYAISMDYYRYSMDLPPEKGRTETSNIKEMVGSVNASLNYTWDL